MNAYDEAYLYHAQKTFGHMLDFAVNTCGFDINEYFELFLSSDVCRQFETGNPAYIAGRTGCELVRDVIYELQKKELSQKDIMYIDRSPEYWLGWSLAYYQWLRNDTFKHILKYMSADEMLNMYYTLHEADISKFVDALDEITAENGK